MVLLLACIGIYSRCQRKPVIESVERDTVVVYDTVPHYFPKPVEVEKVRTEYRWLTRVQPVGKTDTLLQRDSVLVEIPITSKHYSAPEYDAWVSGYEANLDSLFVYQKKVLVTEIRTVSKPPNKVALFLNAGVGYTFNDKKFYPHAGGELVFNTHKRFQFAVEGGVTKTPLVNGVNPYAGGKVKIRVF